jgi:SAM-dependent methyltransferase
MARQHGLQVTGLDLDPAMIARARANADRPGNGDGRRPSFLVGDVASLAFPDASFDLVVTTLSMHHWADPAAGLAEIGRVLRPGGRALVWDFRPGVRPHPFGPRHAHTPDPVEHAHGSPLRVVQTTPWRWPWRFNLTQRIELARADGSPGPSRHRAMSACLSYPRDVATPGTSATLGTMAPGISTRTGACGIASPVVGQAGLQRTGRATMPWSRNLRRT